MTRLLLALNLLCCLPLFTLGQLPVIRGNSQAHSGMLHYDVQQASDQQEKRFLFTICPDSAQCLQLDFTLVQSALEADFIRIYPGKEAEGSPLESLGGISQDRLLQFAGDCFTVEFLRDAKGLSTTWTLLWKSDREGNCIRSGEQAPNCPGVTEVCGREYRETFRYYDPAPSADQAVAGSCLRKPHHSSWYKFVAQRDGELEFALLPHNGRDDYDWGLWRADSTHQDICPDSLQLAQRLACNYASGRAQLGSTGMGSLGTSFQSSSSGNPVSRPVYARKGDTFFLLVNDYSEQSQGFTLRFNRVVLECDNPARDFVPLNQTPITGRPKIPSHNQFSRYTRVIRLDLNEKINQPLQSCSIEGVDWDQGMPLNEAKSIQAGFRSAGGGIHGLLITGMKLGRFPAWSCEDLTTPIHYGDLLQLMRASGMQRVWDQSPANFAGFGQYIELIVDEVFDKNTGRKQQILRMVRLIWSDLKGEHPDYQVALFQYEDLAPYLDQVLVSNPHNDVSNLSLKDIFKNQQYHGFNLQQQHRPNRSPGEAAFQQQQQLEFEAYHWGR